MNHLPGFIYAVEFCLVDYGQLPEYQNIFQEAFNHIIDQTSKLLTSLDAFYNYSDISFDFFGMSMRYLRLTKHTFFSSSSIEKLLNMWVMGIGIEHRDAVETHS